MLCTHSVVWTRCPDDASERGSKKGAKRWRKKILRPFLNRKEVRVGLGSQSSFVLAYLEPVHVSEYWHHAHQLPRQWKRGDIYPKKIAFKFNAYTHSSPHVWLSTLPNLFVWSSIGRKTVRTVSYSNVHQNLAINGLFFLSLNTHENA